MNNLIYKTNYTPLVANINLRDQIRGLKVYKAKNPSMSFFSTSRTVFGGDNPTFAEHEYDLYETGRIIDTEAFVARCFSKKVTLVFKEGYSLECKDPKNLEYIKQRLEEIQYISKISFRKMIKELAYNLVAFHNSYIVKVRKLEASTGKVRKWRGQREVPPIAAYFSLAPETIQTKLNEAGEPIRFKQSLGGGRYREFADYNIIHAYYNKRTGFTMGTPPLEAVRDDILALRRIEESVETLIYKSLFPIIHVKVGTDKTPAKNLPNGVSEVSAATELLENIEDNGGVVTSERVEINAIGAESLALRVETYLEHFKKRVYAGLGMSAIDYGDGDTTGRATGEVQSASLMDSVTDYQDELQEIITRDIFDELLLESGRYTHSFEIAEEERVHLVFKTTSVDEQIKKESHSMQKFNANLITCEEAREEMGKECLEEEEREDLNAYSTQRDQDKLEVAKTKELVEHQAEQTIKIAKAAPKPTAAGASSTPKKSTGAQTKKTSGGNTKTKKSKAKAANNTNTNKTKPKNQYSKDSIVKKISSIIEISSSSDKGSLERVFLTSHRILCDYGMNKISHGLIDFREHMDENLEITIRDIVASLMDDIYNSDLNDIKINAITCKMVDKLDRYVNNIIQEI
jgi:hypothetical protein